MNKYKQFKKEVNKYIIKLGLLKRSIQTTKKNNKKSKNLMAWCNCQSDGNFEICFNKAYDFEKQDIKSTAIHELMHVLLFEYFELFRKIARKHKGILNKKEEELTIHLTNIIERMGG